MTCRVFVDDVFEAMHAASETLDDHATLWLGAADVPVSEDADLTVRVNSHYMRSTSREERERAAGFVALLMGEDEVALA